jgi:hypothetical protein
MASSNKPVTMQMDGKIKEVRGTDTDDPVEHVIQVKYDPPVMVLQGNQYYIDYDTGCLWHLEEFQSNLIARPSSWKRITKEETQHALDN